MELLKQDKHFSWLPADGWETLGDCFETQLERLQPGEVRENEGRIGYLVQGKGLLETESGTREIEAGALLGIVRGGPQYHQRAWARLTAAEDCVVYWIAYDVLEFGCYRGCWFHTRFNMTLQKILDEEEN